uniref:Cytochrome P450, family 2, subfamily AA, polypeptide 1 n=1 Tax=Callorhinchus milii TaxID=7868 RepID=A0A4W3HG11_CALMI|eukprot:gi/632983099/ref/XP_007908479.1/ PREDICTED: cytochrome P450 2C31-like [Callorhinchus milii]
MEWSSLWGRETWLDVQTWGIFVMVFVVVTAVMRARKSHSKLPHGPSLWSISQNLTVQALKYPQFGIMKLAKKYGNIFTCYMIHIPMVALNGFQMIQEALVHQGSNFAGRPQFDIFSKGQGIINAPYGKSWKQQRRFLMTILRNFGLGKNAFEEKILEEVRYLIEIFRSTDGRPFNPDIEITNAVSNVICSIVFGERFHYTDPNFIQMTELFDKSLKFQAGIWFQVAMALPFLSSFPGPHQKMFRVQAEIEAIIQDFIKKHRESLDLQKPRDFIDAYLLEMKKEQESPNSCLTEGNLVYNVFDLFVAGTETTATTLRWAILYMMTYPDIQEKCQKEIEQVVGWCRLPCMDDRVKMPYVSAVIHEIQRFGNVVPFTPAHAAIQDTSFRSYTMKKDTIMLVNLTSALFDEAAWKDPNNFNPGNFQNEDGEFVKPEAFIPFSLGLRACPGERVANMELFLFFISLLQSFTFLWPPHAPPPDLRGLYRITLAPRPYTLAVKCRNRQPARELGPSVSQ